MALNIGGDINSEAGLKKLNDYLATKSYVEGYVLLILMMDFE